MYYWLIVCKEWIVENEKWAVPILVVILSLIGAALGGWLAGRKRIGIEILSKNRQEWVNSLRVQTYQLEENLLIFIDLNLICDNLAESIINKKELETISNKIISNLLYVELLLSPNPNRFFLDKLNNWMNTIVDFIPIIFYERKLRTTSNELMSQLNNLLKNFREEKFKNLKQKYTAMVEKGEAPNQNSNLEDSRKDIEKFLKDIHDKTKELIAIEWQRIKRAK